MTTRHRAERSRGTNPAWRGEASLAVLLERDLAVVLPEEVEEPLVVARLHVEETRHDLVVAARLLEPAANHLAHVRPRDLAVHEQRIHGRPDRLGLFANAFMGLVGP